MSESWSLLPVFLKFGSYIKVFDVSDFFFSVLWVFSFFSFYVNGLFFSACVYISCVCLMPMEKGVRCPGPEFIGSCEHPKLWDTSKRQTEILLTPPRSGYHENNNKAKHWKDRKKKLNFLCIIKYTKAKYIGLDICILMIIIYLSTKS